MKTVVLPLNSANHPVAGAVTASDAPADGAVVTSEVVNCDGVKV